MMRYRAFFSYARADDKIANWLHRQLDAYRTPRSFVGTEGALGDVPTKLHPIFRDRTDLEAGGHVTAALEAALQESRTLIVLCTPTSAKSHWVNQEIETFLRLGRGDAIFPIIAAGEPESGDPNTECFPPALRGRGLLAADLREIKLPNGQLVGDGREGGRLKLIAGLLGVSLDRLIQRERRRQRQLVATLTVATLTFLAIAFAAVAFWLLANQRAATIENQQDQIVEERDEARRQRDAALLRESALVAYESLSLVNRGQGAEASERLLGVLPNASQIDRPLSWEALAALSSAISAPAARIDFEAADERVANIMFSPDGDTVLVTSRRENGAVNARLHSISSSKRVVIKYPFRSSAVRAIFLTLNAEPAIAVSGNGDGEALVFQVSELTGAAKLPTSPFSAISADAAVFADGLQFAIISQGPETFNLDKRTGVLKSLPIPNSSLLGAHADTGSYAAVIATGVAIGFLDGPARIREISDVKLARFSNDGSRVGFLMASNLLIEQTKDGSAAVSLRIEDDVRCGDPIDFAIGAEGNGITLSKSAICRFGDAGELLQVIDLPEQASALSPDGEWAIARASVFRTRSAFRFDAVLDGNAFEADGRCATDVDCNAKLEVPDDRTIQADGTEYSLSESPAVVSPSGRYAVVETTEGFAVVDRSNSAVACRTKIRIRSVFDSGPTILVSEGRLFDVLRCAPGVGNAELSFDQGASIQSGIGDGPQFTALSLDGQRLLTSGAEQTIKLWNVEARRLIWSSNSLSDVIDRISVDGRLFELQSSNVSGAERILIALPPSSDVLLNASNWGEPARPTKREITGTYVPLVPQLPGSATTSDNECPKVARQMSEEKSFLPPVQLVDAVIRCAGLVERVQIEIGDDMMLRDIMVMYAARNPQEDLDRRFEWLTPDEVGRLRKAAGAEGTQ